MLAAAAACTLLAQSGSLTFEVASVKRSPGNASPDFAPRRSGDHVIMHNIRVPSIVLYAYHLEHGLATTSYQLTGNLEMPDGWEVYDIDALAPGSPSEADLRMMFQNLLHDRFQLKTHWVTRDLELYDLTLAKNGLKLKPAAPKTGAEPPFHREPGVSYFIGRGDSFEQIVDHISARLELPVRNLTGLTGGSFDYVVPFIYDPTIAGTTAAPTFFDALQRELGLKLKHTHGPVQVLVVDHIEKPSEN